MLPQLAMARLGRSPSHTVALQNGFRLAGACLHRWRPIPRLRLERLLRCSQIMRVVELQRAFIESRHVEKHYLTSGSPLPVVIAIEAENELRWYTDQAARLNKFKAVLNALRLLPEEFPLLAPQAWVARTNGRTAAASGELVPLLLRINARSQLTLLPTPSAFEQRMCDGVATCSRSSNDGDLADDLGHMGSTLGAPRLFFMDSLRCVCLVQIDGGELDSGVAAASVPTAFHGGTGGVNAAAAVAASAPQTAQVPRALTIDLVGEPPLTCVTTEAAELVQVFGAHLKRYKTSRVAQVDALKAIHLQKCTPYDASDPAHEELLRRLWSCGFGPAVKCELCSERWVHLGFQSADPTRDLRGMGLLGLANLVYFGEHYSDVFQRLVAAQRKRDYPLACAGINITALLLELLRMKDDGEPATIQSRPPFDGAWGSDLFHFFCHMFYREHAFDDMYCFCLRLLDRMVVAMDANYAEFNTVVTSLRVRLVEALAQRPLSFREFKRLMSATSSESEGSVRSSRSGCDVTSRCSEPPCPP